MRQPDRNRRAAPPRRRYSLWGLIRANLYDLGLLLNESWVVLAGFLAVVLIGTLYLSLFYDPCLYDADPASLGCSLGPGEALYETLKLQTLQSGLPYPRGSLAGQALFFLTPLLGLALIFQGVLNFGRLLLDKGSRREAWQIALASTYRDHVIVCGLGRVGMRTVQQLLDAGHAPVVIERDWNSEFVERAVNNKVPVIVGDAREPLTLRRAGLARARALVAAINDDLLNIEIALTARSLQSDARLVLRVFSDELDSNLEKTLGTNTAFSASALAAPTFAAAAVSREIDYVLPAAAGQLGVMQLAIEPGSRLSGTAGAVEAAWSIRLLAHENAAGRLLAPAPSNQLSGRDRVAFVGPPAALEAARLANLPGSAPDEPHAGAHLYPTDQFDTVIVCGLGKVGYRVVRQLHAIQPRPRIVVVRTADGRIDFPQRIAQLEGVETVIGDAREPDVLRRAGVEQAFSIAALTSDDLLNLQISLAARRIRPDIHTVLRVFSDALADRLVEMFGIRTAYSTSGLASPTLAAAALVGGVDSAFVAAGQLYASIRLPVAAGGPLAGRSVEEIRAQLGALVLELEQSQAVVASPLPETRLGVGDTVWLLGPIEVIARLR